MNKKIPTYDQFYFSTSGLLPSVCMKIVPTIKPRSQGERMARNVHSCTSTQWISCHHWHTYGKWWDTCMSWWAMLLDIEFFSQPPIAVILRWWCWRCTKKIWNFRWPENVRVKCKGLSVSGGNPHWMTSLAQVAYLCCKKVVDCIAIFFSTEREKGIAALSLLSKQWIKRKN